MLPAVREFLDRAREPDGVVASDFEALRVALTRSSVRGSPTAV